MRKTILLMITFLLTIAGMASAESGNSPLHIKNTHPLFLLPATPLAVTARCEDAIEVGLTYSSTYLVEDSARWSVGLDMETAVLEIEIRKLLGHKTELGFYLPFISHQSGVLDGPLDAYHSALGVGDYGRSQRPENEFLYQIRRDGQLVVQGRASHAALGDARLTLKRQLLSSGPTVSLYGYVELPTGNADSGFGSGSTGAALAVLSEGPVGRDGSFFVNLGAVHPGDLKAMQTVELRDYLYGAFGLGWRYSAGLSFHTQAFIQQSPYDMGIREVDSASVLWSLGARHGPLELAFSEDLNTAGSPDFMVGITYRAPAPF